MPLTPARRLFAGAAVAAVAVVAGALPASAAPAADVEMYLPDLIAPAGFGSAKIDPIFFSAEPLEIYDARVTYRLSGDVTGLSITGDDDEGSNCEPVSAVEVTCTDGIIFADPGGYTAFFDAVVRADDSAVLGSTATLTATFSGQDVAEVTQTATVTVAEAVDLTAGTTTEVSAKPGGSFEAPVAVSNTAGKTITGAAVLFWNDYAITTTEQFSNCRYLDGELVACVFDQELEPGAAYRATMPYRLRPDTYAPGREASENNWMTAAEFADFEKYLNEIGIEFGTPGDGPEFTLETMAAQRRGVPQTDPNQGDNWSVVEVNVTGKNGTDLVAVGADLTGAAGAEVTAEIGVDNNGPATLDLSRVGTSAAVTKLTVPAGVEVVSAPAECLGRSDDDTEGDFGEPGHPVYTCFSEPVLVAGDKLRYEFGFRISDAASAPGRIVVNEPCECEGFQDDLDKKNNVALLTVNGITDGGTGGGDGDGPTLPITGPAGITIAVSGVVLLGLGALGLMVARRRRTTFVS